MILIFKHLEHKVITDNIWIAMTEISRSNNLKMVRIGHSRAGGKQRNFNPVQEFFNNSCRRLSPHDIDITFSREPNRDHYDQNAKHVPRER